MSSQTPRVPQSPLKKSWSSPKPSFWKWENGGPKRRDVLLKSHSWSSVKAGLNPVALILHHAGDALKFHLGLSMDYNLLWASPLEGRINKYPVQRLFCHHFLVCDRCVHTGPPSYPNSTKPTLRQTRLPFGFTVRFCMFTFKLEANIQDPTWSTEKIQVSQCVFSSNVYFLLPESNAVAGNVTNG